MTQLGKSLSFLLADESDGGPPNEVGLELFGSNFLGPEWNGSARKVIRQALRSVGNTDWRAEVCAWIAREGDPL